MLSKPKHGWSNFTLGDFTAQASYIEDLPFDWARTLIFSLRRHIPAALYIEEEGSQVYILTHEWGTYLIVDREEKEELLSFEEINFTDFARDLLFDLETYFEDWVQWSPYEDGEEAFKQRRTHLQNLLNELRKVLQDKGGLGHLSKNVY